MPPDQHSIPGRAGERGTSERRSRRSGRGARLRGVAVRARSWAEQASSYELLRWPAAPLLVVSGAYAGIQTWQDSTPLDGALVAAAYAIGVLVMWRPRLGAVLSQFVLAAAGLFPDLRIDEVRLPAQVLVGLVVIVLLPWRWVLAWYAALLVWLVAPGFWPGHDWAYSTTLAGLAVLTVGLGLTVRRHYRRRTAGQQRLVALERQRPLVRDAERLRLAHDLHDAVAHQLSIASLQVLAVDAQTRPDELRAALDRIHEACRSALAELRVLVDVLGQSRPQAQQLLAEQADLAAAVAEAEVTLRDHGFVPRVDLQGDPSAVEGSVRQTLARLVREAQTNVLRHAPVGAVVTLGVVIGPTLVRLRCANPAPVSPPTRLERHSLGMGLAAARERVLALGGSCSYGRSGDDWVLEATLPSRPTVQPVPAPTTRSATGRRLPLGRLLTAAGLGAAAGWHWWPGLAAGTLPPVIAVSWPLLAAAVVWARGTGMPAGCSPRSACC